MRALRTAVVLVLALALPAPVLAADFQVGMNAYKRGDYASALKEWRPLAEQGNTLAQYQLAWMYSHGEGVPQDYTEAAKWVRLVAEKGSDQAQHNLGVHYRLGQGVTQNYAEAMKWYRLAAEQGNTDAMYSLGYMYFSGEGVTQHYVQAHKWYNLAAARLPPGEDRDSAVHSRDLVAKQMTPEQIAEAQRLAREWKPK